jgi:hypothetical protein
MEIVVIIIKLIMQLIDLWREQDKQKQESKRQAVNTVVEGIAVNDLAKITAGFETLNRIRKG